MLFYLNSLAYMRQAQARLLLFKSWIVKLIIDHNVVAKVIQDL